MMRLGVWSVVWAGFLLVACVGSPEPRNPLTKPVVVKAEEAPTTALKASPVKCLRCEWKNTVLANPLLTDEEQEILKRTDVELEKLYPKVELEKEKKVY